MIFGSKGSTERSAEECEADCAVLKKFLRKCPAELSAEVFTENSK